MTLKPKWSGPERAAIRTAYIGAAGAVLAAVIAALAIYLPRGSSGAGHPSAQGSPSAATRTSTSPSPSPSPAISSAPASAARRTWAETTFSQSKTFADYVNAGYPLGAPLSARQVVKVSCRVRGFVVKDGDPWWYRLASPPWDGRYYATSDVFYNIPDTSGNPINGVVVDKRVPVCGP